MTAVPDQIARWVPDGRFTAARHRRLRPQSDTREALRRFFETDAAHVVVAVLSALAAAGDVKPEVVGRGHPPLRHRPRGPRPRECRSAQSHAGSGGTDDGMVDPRGRHGPFAAAAVATMEPGPLTSHPATVEAAEDPAEAQTTTTLLLPPAADATNQESLGFERVGVLWRYDAAERLTTGLALAGEVIFGTTHEGKVFALDRASGRELWANESPYQYDRAGRERWSANRRGRTWVQQPGRDRPEPDSGAERWRHELPSFQATPDGVIVGDRFVVSAMDVFALDVETGVERWRIPGSGSPEAPSARGDIATDGERVYVPVLWSIETRLEYGIRGIDGRTGTLVWQLDQTYVNQLAAVAGGLVGTEVYQGETSLYGYDVATGELLWEHSVRGDIEQQPALSAGRLFVGGAGFLLGADMATGGVLWSQPADGRVRVSASAERVYLTHERLTVLDSATGAFVARSDDFDTVTQAPAIEAGNVVVLQFAHGELVGYARP